MGDASGNKKPSQKWMMMMMIKTPTGRTADEYAEIINTERDSSM